MAYVDSYMPDELPPPESPLAQEHEKELTLCAYIVLQSVKDYRYALKRNDERRIGEIRSFFASDWATDLLSFLGYEGTGEDLRKRVEGQ